MLNNNDIEERVYTFNWLSLFIKVIIFAVLLVLLVWLISLFANKCKKITNDYYITSYFTNSQYETGIQDNQYKYNYTIEIEDITSENSKNLTIKKTDYFHSDKEYQAYLDTKNKNMNIINQSSTGININNLEDLINSSLKSNNFTYEISEIYEFNKHYYIDVHLTIKNRTNIKPYSGVYFVPIHFTLEYNSTECNK